MAANFVKPTHYEMWSRGFWIVFDTTSLTGEPRFHYEEMGFVRDFAGSQIVIESTTAGWLITVVLAEVPDQVTWTATVLIPDINLMPWQEIPFRTMLIITAHLTSIGGPDLVQGVLQNYRFVLLRGLASYLVF